MKKILTILLILILVNGVQAQNKKRNSSNDRSGLVLSGVGVLSMSIGFLVPDGSEWTYSGGKYNSNIVRKPFYKNPARVACIGIGLTLTIGGGVFTHRSNKY